MEKRIGILTSGGDAPGMNACIRAVVRSACNNGVKVFGFRRGYEGVIGSDIEVLTPRSVSDIIHRGGTILKTARCKEMLTEDGVERAARVCEVLRLDALMVLGGNGSFKGALSLSKRGVNVFGVPATIDLDLDCTEYTIGFDTAINTAMEAINKIRDTSTSHERCSIVEVMGRDAGFIALWCGITSGAEEVLVPEDITNDSVSVINQIIYNRSMGKTHNLVIIAEGRAGKGKSESLAEEIESTTGIETRATILGHMQRGGSPTALDRMHGSMMGFFAVESFLNNETNKVIAFKDGKYAALDFAAAMEEKRVYDPKMYEILKSLSI